MKAFQGVAKLEHAVGSHLGYSDWHTITQEQIDLFAEATGDQQWIHIEPERAAAGPFGTTIAHGFLTLSLLPMLTWQVYEITGAALDAAVPRGAVAGDRYGDMSTIDR